MGVRFALAVIAPGEPKGRYHLYSEKQLAIFRSSQQAGRPAAGGQTGHRPTLQKVQSWRRTTLILTKENQSTEFF